MASLSSYSIMNVREIIDTAFGNIDENTVNFKLIQVVLLLLANQLRILQRRVHIAMPSEIFESETSLIIKEFKILGKKKKPVKINPKTAKGKNKSSSSSSDKTSTDKSKGSADKTKKNVIKGTGKSTIAKATDKTSLSSDTKKDGSKLEVREDESKLADRHDILEDYVDNAEKVLRVIHQRADSREQPVESPTPMASAENIEVQQEKLLVVERVPSDSKSDKSKDAKISVVTQEEFQELAEVVGELRERLQPIGMAEFPENAQLMKELRKTASLTDAMAALQLSARLEAAEKALGHMITIVTEVARNTPGVTLDEDTIKTLEGQLRFTPGEKIKGKQEGKTVKEDLVTKPKEDTISIQLYKTKDVKEYTPKPPNIGESGSNEETKIDAVTYRDLDEAIRNTCDEMMKKLQAVTVKNTATSQQALKLATTLERNLNNVLKVSSRMNDLEDLVKAYAEQINILDTGLSSQMTNYQEQLTQMQHELEVGIDTMAENLANLGGDTVAVAELNSCFTNLSADLENMGSRQKSLQEIQFTFKTDLENLWKQIEMLKDTKSDRDEVTDALRDKAGIGDLNGLVTLEQFDAVRGDLEKQILASYQKFNHQEIVWQKAIDDLLREFSEKANLVQVISLKDQIEGYLQGLKNRMQIIEEIVGEPKSAAVTKKLFRDATCLCCASPASMDIENPGTIPISGDVKKPNDISNKTKVTGDGDHKKCYPGLSVTHPTDPRSHFCRRYCGGSHTLIPSTLSKTPPATIITALTRETNLDDKVHETDGKNQNRPCLPCNLAFSSEENHPTHQCRS